MKKSIFILGIAAAAVAMVSCNKDEIKKIDNPTFEGDKAYIVVNINDVGGSSTRATDGGFAYGTSDEHAINDVHFCFYDADGFFVTAATAGTLSGTASETSPAVNVEFQSNTVVVLEHLAHTTYPSYVVTVINAPEASFTAPNTLNDFVELIATSGAEGIQNTGFAMSTSSYYASDPYYFATPVTSDNFALEPIEYGPDGVTPTNCQPVYIYVERLAAKVEVAVDPNSDMAAKATTINGVTAYQLDSIDLDGDGVAEQAIYVTLDGWAVNATSRESFLMKEIDPTWRFDGWDWNDADNYRSYWGMSTAYGYGLGTGDFPTSSKGNTDYDETQVSTELSQYLKYTSLSEPLDFGDYTYCAENTNTASAGNGVIQSKNSSAVTAVLVAATVVDENGEGLDLIKHSGILYTPESYMNYALGHIAQYWYRIPDTEVDDEAVYYQISTDIIEFQDAYDGYVVIGVKDEVINAEEGYYLFYTSTDGENFEDSTLAALEGSIATFIATYGDDANYYNGGLMYYNVPIEHLNNATDTTGEGLIYEGNYGVVRNHWYQITINDIAGLGKGIYNPEEVIIPGLETELYYIGANINILSWKVVEQGVTLQ